MVYCLPSPVTETATLVGMGVRRGWFAERGGVAGTACALFRLGACGALVGLSGCTVYPEQKPATLEMTTSAEQVQRIFWQDVAQGKWVPANALLAPNTVWRVGDRVIAREQIIPWLQSRGIHEALVTGVTLTPAVNDMNMVYTVQVQAEHALDASANGAACGSQPQTLSALAVWQQPQPTGNPPAKNDKQYRGYLLTVHDLTAAANSACH